MRLILFIAVIALFVDFYFYSGANSRSAYTHVSIAAQQFVAFIGDAVEVGPDRQSSKETTRI